MNIAFKTEKREKKYKNYVHLYLQARGLHKNEVKNGKKVKKAENRPAPPLARVDFIADTKKN